MAHRENDFLQRVKRAVALRAAYQCSFDGCPAITVGPSDESSDAVAHVGEAAHIHAASPGGKRYLGEMSKEERRGIDNAIWMCPTHATLIDEDETTYTAAVLHAMKRTHEQRIAAALAMGGSVRVTEELIAIGPDVLCLGTLRGGQGNRWCLAVEHFVMGDLTALTEFSERFDKLAPHERYVLVEGLRDGRVLTAAPSWRLEDRVLIDVDLAPSAQRIAAQELGRTLKMDLETEDLTRNWATVSGVDVLPQLVRICLWGQQGELPFGDWGTRLAEFYHLFGQSPWFSRLLALEVVRMAAIPHLDSLTGKESTPLRCVSRVLNLEVLEDEPIEQRLRVRITLDVVGIGTWSDVFRLWIRKFPFEPSEPPSHQAVP